MNESKLQIKIGTIEFSGEGDQTWLSSELAKVIDKAPDLLKVVPPMSTDNGKGNGSVQTPRSNGSGSGNLALFLKEKNATTQQVSKFLATAAFIQIGGKSKMTTADITKVLREANQSKLNNASDCLNQNVKKGFCQKDGGNDFFVT